MAYLETSSHSHIALPYESLVDEQYAIGVFEYGSLMSMLIGKKATPTTILHSLFDHNELRDIFIDLTGADSFKSAVYDLLRLNPTLIDSKYTKHLITKLNGSRRDRAAHLQ